MTTAAKRLQTELRNIKKKPLSDVTAEPCENGDLYTWNAVIHGPLNTPYENGKFKLTLKFPENYPFKPPKAKFDTKIYHPNISQSGEICLDILKDEAWSPALSIQQLLLSISSLVATPNEKDPLSREPANHYINDRNKYDEIVKEWVTKYAL
jgi:ubiquitin-conjugating enzyme E2 D/E